MEKAVIIACIAAITSLISILVNFIIARNNQKHSQLSLKLEVAIKAGEAAAENLRTYGKEAELLRNECWNFMSELSHEKKSTGWHDNSFPSVETYNRFDKQFGIGIRGRILKVKSRSI